MPRKAAESRVRLRVSLPAARMRRRQREARRASRQTPLVRLPSRALPGGQLAARRMLARRTMHPQIRAQKPRRTTVRALPETAKGSAAPASPARRRRLRQVPETRRARNPGRTPPARQQRKPLQARLLQVSPLRARRLQASPLRAQRLQEKPLQASQLREKPLSASLPARLPQAGAPLQVPPPSVRRWGRRARSSASSLP